MYPLFNKNSAAHGKTKTNACSRRELALGTEIYDLVTWSQRWEEMTNASSNTGVELDWYVPWQRNAWGDSKRGRLMCQPLKRLRNYVLPFLGTLGFTGIKRDARSGAQL